MISKSGYIPLDNAHYPKMLSEIQNPPKGLYYEGDPSLLNKQCLAIVGTRKYSDYGEVITKEIIEEISSLDLVIVSGLAKGIDTFAHMAALEFGLPTIAVLGSGIKNIYPRQNNLLADEIRTRGLMISEYEGDTEPLNYQFPMRNRIISGLSLATLVIESPERSGALITAKFALEQGREVLAVPGDVDRKNSRGPLRLLQNGGAYPVASGQDIMSVLNKQPSLFKEQLEKQDRREKVEPRLTKEQKTIYSHLSRRPKQFDELQEKTKFSTEKILETLTMLEIQGIISTKNGKYSRKW